MRVKSTLLTTILATAVVATWSCQDHQSGPAGLEDSVVSFAKKCPAPPCSGGDGGDGGGVQEPASIISNGAIVTNPDTGGFGQEQDVTAQWKDDENFRNVGVWDYEPEHGSTSTNIVHDIEQCQVTTNDPMLQADMEQALQHGPNDPAGFHVRIDLQKLGGPSRKNFIGTGWDDPTGLQSGFYTVRINKGTFGNPTVTWLNKDNPDEPLSDGSGRIYNDYEFTEGTAVVRWSPGSGQQKFLTCPFGNNAITVRLIETPAAP
jgi:hypothetical protein